MFSIHIVQHVITMSIVAAAEIETRVVFENNLENMFKSVSWNAWVQVNDLFCGQHCWQRHCTAFVFSQHWLLCQTCHLVDEQPATTCSLVYKHWIVSSCVRQPLADSKNSGMLGGPGLCATIRNNVRSVVWLRLCILQWCLLRIEIEPAKTHPFDVTCRAWQSPLHLLLHAYRELWHYSPGKVSSRRPFSWSFGHMWWVCRMLLSVSAVHSCTTNGTPS